MNVGQSFWEAFKSSTILQGILAIMIWGGVIAMYMMGMDVPLLLAGAAGAIMAHYFNTKSEQQGARIASQSAQQLAQQYASLVQTSARQSVNDGAQINPPFTGDVRRRN